MSEEYKRQTSEELSQSILSAEPSELKQAQDMFNLYLLKKSAARAIKCDEVLDDTIEEISDRLKHRAVAIDDETLLSYLTTVSSVQEKATLMANGESTIPQIKLVQNNVTVQTPELARESRERVLDFVEQFMKKNKIETEGDIVDDTDADTE